jgi:hypothetical protein
LGRGETCSPRRRARRGPDRPLRPDAGLSLPRARGAVRQPGAGRQGVRVCIRPVPVPVHGRLPGGGATGAGEGTWALGPGPTAEQAQRG